MKILYIINGFGGGGKERRLLQLTKGLIDKGVSILILSVSTRKNYDIKFDAPNIQIIELQEINRVKIINFISYYLKNFKPDIVHLWCSIPIVSIVTAVGKFIYRYKLIAGFIADANPITGTLLKIVTQFVYIIADAVVGNSKAGIIAQKAPSRKSFVIYNGFDFARLNNLQNISKKQYGINHKYIVSMFARVDECKDYNMFLNVAKRIESLNKNILFLGIGQGSMLDTYKNKLTSEKIGNVIFLGFRKDVEALLKISDICLLFTNNNYHAEGISNSILEAMAAGKPIIATDGGGTPEIIINDIDGYIIQPHDCDAAANLIIKLIEKESLRVQIGNNAQKKIHQKFSLERMTNEYINLYSNLLK